MTNSKKERLLRIFIIFFSICCVWFICKSCFVDVKDEDVSTQQQETQEESGTSNEEYFAYVERYDFYVGNFTGNPYVIINNNVPVFNGSLYNTEPIEMYSPLDRQGRCQEAFANVCVDIMPTEERGSIGNVHPTGWHTIKYDFISGKYLYNRCHLIGYQLSGENDNVQNLITGTRYLNIDGMLPFENSVASYIEKNPDGNILYRVTPIFNGDERVARGVLMEALSVNIEVQSYLSFCVFCYNVQPGVIINYSDGNSKKDENYLDTLSFIWYNNYIQIRDRRERYWKFV